MKYLFYLCLMSLLACSTKEEFKLEVVKNEALDDMISKCVFECDHKYNFFSKYDTDTTASNEIFVEEFNTGNKDHTVYLYIGAVLESKFKASLTEEKNNLYISLSEYSEADSSCGCERVIKVCLNIKGDLTNKRIFLKEINTDRGKIISFGKLN